MLWDEPKIFFLERRYFFSIILSEFLKNRVALQRKCHLSSVIVLITIFYKLTEVFFYDRTFPALQFQRHRS